MSKILLSLLSLVMITVMAGCSAPAPEGEATSPAQERREQDSAEPAGDLPVVEAPAETPAPAAEPAPEAAPAAEGAAPAEAPAPSASAAPLTGTKWA